MPLIPTEAGVPPESVISLLHSVRAGTATANVPIAVTLQFDRKIGVSSPSNSARALSAGRFLTELCWDVGTGTRDPEQLALGMTKTRKRYA